MQTEGSACGHPTASLVKHGACTRASHLGGNRVRGTERSERGRGQDRRRERRWERSRGRERGRYGGESNRRSAKRERGRERGRGENGNGDKSGNPWTNTGWERGRKQEQWWRWERDVDGNENEDMIREGGIEAKKRNKPHKSCRCYVGNGG